MSTPFLPMSAPMRLALINSDAITGALAPVHARVLEALEERGWVERRPHAGAYLTEQGRRERVKVMKNRKTFSVNGLPFPKVDEITTYYLQGRSIEEISHLTRVEGESVVAALAYRRVLAAA